MPQMAPYNWLMLNFYFIIIYIMIIIIIHFNKSKMFNLKSFSNLKKFYFKW